MDKDIFRNVEAIFFDFEGTLVDFQWNLIGAVRETIQMLGTSGFPIEQLQGFKYSTLLNEVMKIAVELRRPPDEVREKIGAIYDRYDEDALTRWTLRPNARQFLSALKAKGMKTGLISNVGKKAMEKAFKKMQLQRFFDAVVTRNDVNALKPSGEGIRLALTRLQVMKDRALFIGDSLDDIQATKEAGLKVIIILGGENANTDLRPANPDFLIQSFDEIIVLLEEG
jgi:HAD superfamily hydrolase (TIGR01509 family)